MYRACFILAFIITSCAPFQDRQILNNVETIISVHPDSALTVLQGMHPHNFPFLHTRQLHALLQSEALDKCYIDITDDSLARYANSYFGDHGTYLHRLKSWYYLGRIYFNAGNYAESVIYYNKALDYAESLQNFHYLGLVNREIANAYEHVWDSTHSIEYIKKAIESFERADEIKYVLYCKLTLARLLRIQKNNTASLEAAKWIIENTDDNYLLASANEHIALLSLSDSDCNIAQVQSFLSKAGIGTELPTNVARLCNLAIMYQKANKPDSADYYIAAAKLKTTRQDWKSTWNEEKIKYSPFFIDFCDTYNQGANDSTYPNDEISGFTSSIISQILLLSSTLYDAKELLKTYKPANITNTQIESYFSYYENL